MKNSNKLILAAAVAGILGGVALAPTATLAGETVHAMGANSCKGSSGCKTAENACKGQNGCKGKGFTEMSKSKCDKLAAKNKKITCEEVAKAN
jgi:hypothetical protein